MNNYKMPCNYYVIDGTNNNYVRGFISKEDAKEWINRTVNETDWSNNWKTEQDFRGEYFIVSKSDMDSKVKKYGKRVKVYYN